MTIRTTKSSPVAKKNLVKRASKAASFIKAKAPAARIAYKPTPAAMMAAKNVARFLRQQGASRVLVFGSLKDKTVENNAPLKQ